MNAMPRSPQTHIYSIQVSSFAGVVFVEHILAGYAHFHCAFEPIHISGRACIETPRSIHKSFLVSMTTTVQEDGYSNDGLFQIGWKRRDVPVRSCWREGAEGTD